MVMAVDERGRTGFPAGAGNELGVLTVFTAMGPSPAWALFCDQDHGGTEVLEITIEEILRSDTAMFSLIARHFRTFGRRR